MPSLQLNAFYQQLRRAALLPDGGGLTDRQLLDCYLASGDESVFEALVRRHGRMVLGVCRRVLRHEQDAEDAFQATFIVLARKGASVRQRVQLASWLYGVAYRTALNARAASTRRRSREKLMHTLPEQAACDKEVWHDLLPVLDQELSRLPEKYRVAILLCDLEGRARRDVARQLALPQGTLSGRLTTGRRLLAAALGRRGIALAGGGVEGALSQAAAEAGVPGPLVASTVKAVARATACHTAAAGAASPKAAALAEAVMKGMVLSKLKAAAVALVLVAALGLSAHAMVTWARPGAGSAATALPVRGGLDARGQKARAPEPPPDGAVGVGQPSAPGVALRQEPLLALPLIEDKEATLRMPKDKPEGLRLAPGKHTVRIALSLHDDPFHLSEEISPDKRTVRFRAPSFNETARPVSRAVEIVIGKGKAKAGKPEWGAAVEGVQIRLRPGKGAWGAGEVPTIQLDLRNQGKKSFAQVCAPVFCHIEFDGKWYVCSRPWVVDGAVSTLEPGAHVDGWVQVTLDGRWVRKMPGD